MAIHILQTCRVGALVIAIGFASLCSPASATCGEKGGPGYRSPDGKCVGWKEINRVYGKPQATNHEMHSRGCQPGACVSHETEIVAG